MSLQHAALRNAIGDSIDALVHLDLRGYGVASAIFQAARALSAGPMVMSAAEAITGRVQPDDAVVLGTGFVFPPWNVGELDGVVGTAVVARALERGLGAKPVVVVEPELTEAAASVLRTAGLQPRTAVDEWRREPRTVLVRSFTRSEEAADAEATKLLDQLEPVVVMSIERPGQNAAGVYHTGSGIAITEQAIKFDACFRAAAASSVMTVAIGDLGNELGMGSLRDTVRRAVPFGRACGCPCGEGIAATVQSDFTLAGSVSDWVAYGLAAALAVTTERRDVLHDADLMIRLLRTAVDAGLVDGSGYAIPAVDGIDERYNARLVSMLGDAIDYPMATRVRYKRMFDEVEKLKVEGTA